MELLFIKSEGAEIGFESESALIKIGILLCDKFQVMSFNYDDLLTLHTLDKKSERQVMKIYQKLVNNSGAVYTDEDVRNFLNTLNILRAMPRKDKNLIIALVKSEKNMKAIYAEVKKQLDGILAQNSMEAMLGFLDDETLVITEYASKDNKELLNIEQRIIDSFLTNDMLHIFDESFFEGGEIITEEDSRFSNIEINDLSSISASLYNAPNLDSLNYNQLKIIRNEFQEKFQPFFNDLELLKNEIKEFRYINEDAVKIGNAVDKYVKRHEELLSSTADENIYFQQIKNSAASKILYSLKVCVTSIRNVVTFYERIEVITEVSKDRILETISRHKDIETCSLYFHTDIKEDERGNSEK